ncbi:MAG: DUF5050 domain-containing protein [Defluviitaleaceae bacterium]|nr:DUF5050 domain-containing protein [Defluviitaleaceae bacterium]
MAQPINLPPYRLNSVISKDTFLTHYAATDAAGNSFTVTEFAPAYMVKRADGGMLDIETQFTEEYAKNLEQFHTMADALNDASDATLPKVEQIIPENNTVYIVRKKNTDPGLFEYMNGKLLSYADAFLFIRGFIRNLADAERFKLKFRFTENELHVDNDGELTLDCCFEWDISFRDSIKDIANLYYRLVCGMPYVKKFEGDAPDANDLKFPPKLMRMLAEIMTGEVLFGSIDHFYRDLKSNVDIKVDREDFKVDTVTTLIKNAIAVLVALLFFAGTFLFVFNVVIPATNSANPKLADPVILEPPRRPQGDAVAPNFSAVAFTDRYDSQNILNGAFVYYDGAEYYRAFLEGEHRFVVRAANGAETTLLVDTRPSFLVEDGGWLYFCDGLWDYSIYRYRPENQALERLYEGRALYPLPIGDYLYFTNHEDRDFLYSQDLATGQAGPYVRTAAYWLAALGDRLYFINGGSDYGIYSVKTGAAGSLAEPVCAANADNLIAHEGSLYFINLDDSTLRAIDPDGRPIGLDCPYKIFSFSLDGEWAVIVEAETHRLLSYNLRTGASVNLQSGRKVMYAQAQYGSGIARAFDYYDASSFARYIVQPGW